MTFLHRNLDISLTKLSSVFLRFLSQFRFRHLNLTRNRLHDLPSLRTSKSQKCLQALVTLDLAANNIENLPQFIFAGLKRLRQLNLQQNRIHFIPDAAFVGLIALNVIRLDGNNLHSLSPELFNDTKQLREIHVQNNSLNVLAPELFAGLEHLTVLDLSHNQLRSEWINSLTLKGLARLTLLNLSYNQLTKIESATFRDAKNIQVLRLNDNHLRQIQDRAFDGLWQLTSLTLANNRLFSVDSNLFAGLRNLKTLSIDSNRLTKLPTKLFQHTTALDELHLNGNKLDGIVGLGTLTQLKSLDFGENLIKTLDATTLGNFTNMLGLRLTENYIESIKAGVLDKMIALQILNLSRNKITHIDVGAFDKNMNLQAIRLDGNYLKDLSGLFARLPTLVWLNVSENRIESFDYTMIPTQLQYLDIHANRIEVLNLEFKQSLALTVLDASANRLSEITGNSLPNSIEHLYLNDNQLRHIQAYTFFKKPNITRVDLVGNQISALDANALRISTVPKGRPLPEFYIGANPYLCDCNLDWLQRVSTETRTQPKLMDLNNVYCKLIYNRGKANVLLIDTQPNQFLCEYHSQCSSLCHCCDFSACDCKMVCPERCTCFHDQSWTSNVIDCSSAAYSEMPANIPMDTTELYIDGNDFGEVMSHALIGRRRLRVLYLNSSNIANIQNRTFFSLNELELLNIADNRLSALNGYEFDGLVKLRELYLQNNHLEQINSDTFVQLQQLKILRLDNNRLMHLNIAETLPRSLNCELRLSVNPWKCECKHFDQFKAFIVRESVKDRYRIKCYSAMSSAIEGTISNAINIGNGTVMPIRIEPYDDGLLVINANASFVCSAAGDKDYARHVNHTQHGSDTSANERASSSSTSSNFQKPTISMLYQHLPVLVTTLLGFFIAILLILIVFIFRQELRVWFHSRFGIRLFYSNTTAIDRHERDKLFDAFVSYSSKDEAFVIEHLAPVLENGVPSYKLCLHYRDFPVGAFIADTIVQAIDSSRRTIMILSKNFIKSEWCRFEFKSAHHQVLRDRRRRLIVILLDDVPQKDLDPDIRLYLKTNTYLQWGDKLFWQRLRFALPDAEITQCPNNIAMELTSNSVAAAASAHRIHNNVSGSIGNSTKDQRRNQNIYETHDMSTLSAHNTTQSTIVTNSR